MAKRRYLQVNELKPEMVEAYKNAHQTMHLGEWKEQLDVLKKGGAEECIVYQYNNLAIMIYECDYIAESFSRLGQDPRRPAWDRFTVPMFANAPKFDGTGEIPHALKIFDLNEQLNGELTEF